MKNIEFDVNPDGKTVKEKGTSGTLERCFYAKDLLLERFLPRRSSTQQVSQKKDQQKKKEEGKQVKKDDEKKIDMI